MLLTATGILALITAVRGGQTRWLVLSGAAFAAGYYVRQSALAGALAAMLTIVLFTRSRRLFAFRLLAFCTGLVLPTLALFALYSQHQTFAELVRNGYVFPPYFIYSAGREYFTSLDSFRQFHRH